MFHRNNVKLVKSGRGSLKYGAHFRPTKNHMRQLEKYTRESANISKFSQNPSRRVPQHARFNPDSVLHTKAQTGETMKWWHHQRLALPNTPPQNWKAPMARGRTAWPSSWTNLHAEKILSIPQRNIRDYILSILQNIVHEEILRDGYDLREVDFEGKPATELPNMEQIKSFVMEEQTIRDRIIRRLLDEHFQIPMSTTERKKIRSVETLTQYVESAIATYREPEVYSVPLRVRSFIEKFHVQPKLGFQFALPQEVRNDVQKSWEKLFLHDWQFGKAVYNPKSLENARGSLTWVRVSNDWNERTKHHEKYPLK